MHLTFSKRITEDLQAVVMCIFDDYYEISKTDNSDRAVILGYVL